jgi:hypothetical protein
MAAAAARIKGLNKPKLTCLPVGTKWRTIDGHEYEVTGVYTVFGKNGYHIKEDGERKDRWKNSDGSPRYVPEDEVKELRERKI